MRAQIICLSALLLASTGAASTQDVVIGVAAPFDEAMQPLGDQLRGGAELATLAVGAGLEVADDGCSPEGGEAAARRLVAAGVDAVVGFVCTEAIEAAMPVFAASGIPVITPGVRTDSLTDRRERTGWPVYRLAPRADAERAAVARLIPQAWREELFAIIDDGTIYGRELAETLRFAAEEAGLQPVFVDTFRPQLDNQIGLVGRLRRAGATHVFAGGDREDIAIMARDAASLDYDLTIAGGEALRAIGGQVALEAGVYMVAPPDWARIADPAVLGDFSEAGIAPDGYAVPAYAAVQVAAAAIDQAEDGGRSLTEVLSSSVFRTIIGEIAFNANGDLVEDVYGLYRFDGRNFQPVE